MAQVICIHSFRRGTGKSSTTANLAALLAVDGRRVGVIDTDIQSPAVHTLFGLEDYETPYALNDYLTGEAELDQVTYDVTSRLVRPRPRLRHGIAGRVFLVPASPEPRKIAPIMHEGYDVTLLNEGIQRLADGWQLDALLLDTHSGLTQETLPAIAISDVLAIVLRPDQQDFQGTAVTLDVARVLNVPRILLVVNMVPSAMDPAEVRTRVQETYHCEVAGVLSHAEEMAALPGAHSFVLAYPGHPVTHALKEVASRLL